MSVIGWPAPTVMRIDKRVEDVVDFEIGVRNPVSEHLQADGLNRYDHCRMDAL